ncbi:MAG: 3-methyl-2-oxobutanoate hydroxymethyltransferase [Candidatus Brocadiia bacterium]
MPRERVTIPYLYALREKGEVISWLTCYDYPSATFMEQAGIEMILVGDSASMVVHGNDSTMPITMDMMVVHAKAVRKGSPSAFVIGDMPFLSYQVSAQDAVFNAGRFMKEAACDAIKLEGGVRIADKVRAIVDAGIPVIGHIGLTPQSSSMLGGFKAQGKDARSARLLIEDAKALEKAGAFGILLECVPTRVSEYIKKSVNCLIFSIGAGNVADGQLLIMHDILGLYQCFTPKFVKQYANIGNIMLEAFKSYASEVKAHKFPEDKHAFTISPAELKKLEEELGK